MNLQIKKGKIYGFIGQNGAGKTTFLRLVTGLAFPTSGTLSLWGNSGTEELQKQRKRIGSMIETPALFPSMTAYQNMEVQRIQRGIPDKSVIKRTLDMVGLQDTGKKSVRNFSLGMRQRLGIAIALLNTPELLILDEPINGLDPAGIVEIRNLLKIIYAFLTIFLYLLKCPQSLILSALRAFCFCGKPHISRSIFLYFRYQTWLKSW
ncbi:ATP-binding cassette domain-containing protein [Mediterraneibacter faecis]|uniref:ATP-binding cassette domain-containing protein n=1 Tax=Mediterraneibacter faecis TaxID=592978 RepID=UPI002ED3FFED